MLVHKMIWHGEENPKLLFCGGHPKQAMSALQITSLFDYMLLSFCTQLKNLSRETKVSGRESMLPWYKGERREKGNTSFWQCTHSNTDVARKFSSKNPDPYC